MNPLYVEVIAERAPNGEDLLRAYMSNAHRPSYDTGAVLDLDAPFDLDHIQQPSRFASDQVRRQLKLYDWPNTSTARQIAGERADFMRSFLTQMRRERSTYSPSRRRG